MIKLICDIDGSHNDSRMNVSIAMTAAAYGAAVTNYVNVEELLKNDEGKVMGVKARDLLKERNGEESDVFLIKAKASCRY
jgi:glycerol-3-phosphate dehydrogenase